MLTRSWAIGAKSVKRRPDASICTAKASSGGRNPSSRAPRKKGEPSRTHPSSCSGFEGSVAHPHTGAETRTESIEEHRVGRVVGPTAPAAAWRDRRLLVEEVIDRTEQLDILRIATARERNAVGHCEAEIARPFHAVAADRVLNARIVTRIFRPDALNIVDALAEAPPRTGDVEAAIVVSHEGIPNPGRAGVEVAAVAHRSGLPGIIELGRGRISLRDEIILMVGEQAQ